MILRNRLKERRAALNVNQQEMGRLCGVSRQTISLIERGDYSPSVTLPLEWFSVRESVLPAHRPSYSSVS